jgi:phenylacetate-CoA ligase
MKLKLNLRKQLYYGSHRMIGRSLGQVYENYYREDRLGLRNNIVEPSLAKLLDHCEASVPYYADLIAGVGGSYRQDPKTWLRGFPILTKEKVRKNFGRLQSRDLASRKWIYNTSGGSTGEPVRLIQDRDYLDCQMAVQMLSFNWAGRDFGEPAVRIWGSERDILEGSMGLPMRILNWLTNDQYLNAYRMTPERMRTFIELLNARPPALIIAYPQAIYELAQFAEREGLAVARQTAILTSAGMLYSFMREKLKKVFGCEVFNRYGSREVGDIASECREHAGLHVFPWTNYVEIVDDEGRPVPNGKEGNILVTCLTNYAMPLIRYAIGDRGILSQRERCSCGRSGQILQKVSGRIGDSFRTKDGTLVYGGYFTQLLYFRDWVVKFQVIQKTYSRILFRIAKSEMEPAANELKEIANKTRVVMGADCQVEFEFVADIPPSHSGKYRYTISEVKPRTKQPIERQEQVKPRLKGHDVQRVR